MMTLAPATLGTTVVFPLGAAGAGISSVVWLRCCCGVASKRDSSLVDGERVNPTWGPDSVRLPSRDALFCTLTSRGLTGVVRRAFLRHVR